MGSESDLPRFLNQGAVNTWGWVILHCGDCPVHCRMFNSIPSLYPVDTIGSTPAVTTSNFPRHCQNTLGDNLTVHLLPRLRTTSLAYDLSLASLFLSCMVFGKLLKPQELHFTRLKSGDHFICLSGLLWDSFCQMLTPSLNSQKNQVHFPHHQPDIPSFTWVWISSETYPQQNCQIELCKAAKDGPPLWLANNLLGVSALSVSVSRCHFWGL